MRPYVRTRWLHLIAAQQGVSVAALTSCLPLTAQDGRAGVPGTLHRISVLRNRSGTPIGLTYRLGRHVPDVARLLADTLSSMKASIMPGTPAER
jgi:hypothetical protein